MHFYRLIPILCCLLSWIPQAIADETPLPLGASDLAPDARFESFKGTTAVIDLEKAFEVEAVKQLDLDVEWTEPSELELLRRENRLLKIRVERLERRLAAVEAEIGMKPTFVTPDGS